MSPRAGDGPTLLYFLPAATQCRGEDVSEIDRSTHVSGVINCCAEGVEVVSGQDSVALSPLCASCGYGYIKVIGSGCIACNHTDFAKRYMMFAAYLGLGGYQTYSAFKNQEHSFSSILVT